MHGKREIMKNSTREKGSLFAEHQVLSSYFSSKTSPDETVRVLYNILLLVSGQSAPDVSTTIRYCLEDATISKKMKNVFRQKAADIERRHTFLTEDHVDIKYSRGGRTSYDDYEREQAIELLDALNEFFIAAETYHRFAGRKPAGIVDSILDDMPRVICRLGGANPEGQFTHQEAPEMKDLIERSRSVDRTTEFIARDWYL